MHRYLLSGMFVGILTFFMAVSAIPSHATQPVVNVDTRKLFSNSAQPPPSTLLRASASAKLIVSTATSPTPTNKPSTPPAIASNTSSIPLVVSPAPAVTPTVMSHPMPTPTLSVGVTQDSFISAINQYRASQGISAVQSNEETCNFASTRAGEIVGNFSHDGFISRINSHTLPYPSYHEVTENIAMTSDASQVVAMWIASPGHAENMRKDTPFVCVRQSGNYFAYEGLRL